MRALFGKSKRPESVTEDGDALRDRTREKVLEFVRAPYDAAVEELETLHREFASKIAERRAVVDELKAADARIAELHSERSEMPQKLTEAQLADDDGAVRELKARHEQIGKDLQRLATQRERTAATLAEMPEEFALSAELKRKADSIDRGFGSHESSGFLSTAVRGQEAQCISAVADAARRCANEHTARGADPGLQARVQGAVQGVSPAHRAYVPWPEGVEEQLMVRFLRSNSPYNAGEVAGMPESHARKLVEAGVVEIVEPGARLEDSGVRVDDATLRMDGSRE